MSTKKRNIFAYDNRTVSFGKLTNYRWLLCIEQHMYGSWDRGSEKNSVGYSDCSKWFTLPSHMHVASLQLIQFCYQMLLFLPKCHVYKHYSVISSNVFRFAFLDQSGRVFPAKDVPFVGFDNIWLPVGAKTPKTSKKSGNETFKAKQWRRKIRHILKTILERLTRHFSGVF